MNEIRVTYSGLISFAVGLIGIISGLIFTITITRQLSPTDLGMWTLIGGITTYVIILESTVSYWISREIARGTEEGKTAIITSGILSGGAVIVYFLISYFVTKNSNLDLDIMVFAIITIPAIFLNRTISAISYGTKPHSSSYGTLAFESVKIPIALVFVYFLHLGVKGAIVSITLSYIVSTIILLFFVREKIKNHFKVELVKKWLLKLSWISLYPQLSNFLNKFDVLIFTTITGSVLGLAYYTASITISSLVSQAGAVSRAIYPKLLKSNKNEHLEGNLTILFYFMVPLFALSITFVKPALYALNPIYESGTLIGIFLIIKMSCNTISGVFYQSLLGMEKVDENDESTFKDYLRSKLFFLPTLQNFQYIIYIVILSVGLIILRQYTNVQLEFTIFWSILAAAMEIPVIFYLYILIKKSFNLKIDYKTIVKYVIASVASFGVIFIIMNHMLQYKNSIFEFLPQLLMYGIAGIILYILITYALDIKTRKLFKAIIHEVINKY